MRQEPKENTAMRTGWMSALCVSVVAAAIAVAVVVPVVSVKAQAGGTRGAAPAQSPGASTPQGRAAGSQMRTDVDLLHVMRGILFPSSNVVFAAQDDLSVWKPAADPSTSPN